MGTKADIVPADHFYVGEDKRLRFTVKDSADKAVDITGWTLEFVVRQNHETTATPLITKTSGSGIVIVDAAKGILEVQIEDTDTVNADGTYKVRPGIYAYSLRKTNAGDESVLAIGELHLLPSAAR